MSDKTAKKQLFLPLWALVLWGIALLSLAIYLIAVISPAFAAFFQRYVAGAVRFLLAAVTSPLPFSLAEILLYLSPLLLVFIGVLAFKKHSGSWRTLARFSLSVLSLFSLFFSLFVFSFGTGYHTESLDKRLGLVKTEVTVQELCETARILVVKTAEASEKVEFGEDGFSVMPYDFEGMTDELLASFATLSDEYDFLQCFKSRPKPVLASKAMSYTHITGVYSYYTGEANVNVYFPDYALAFTAAHEMAHQRGIAREDEANFIAFLVTATASDPYLRYAGYLNMLEYVGNALWAVDREAYREIFGALPEAVKGELRAYAEFFRQFSNSTASKVSNAVNDTYLKVNGEENGTASYGLVVDLAVAYYKNSEAT